jgi:CRP-like cAMP-binding protein
VNELASIEKVVFLESVVLFSYCTAEELLRIAAISTERGFAAGEVLYEANEPSSHLHCVVSGEVVVDGPGDERRTVGPCGTLGVVEILSGKLRAGTARAASATRVLAIDAEDFFDLLSNNIDIVKSLFRILLDERRPEFL